MDKLKAVRVQIRELPRAEDWEKEAKLLARSERPFAPVIVDGVLGTGIRGAARGAASGAICFINSFSAQSIVVAVDVPSGMNSDTGMAEGEAVTADWTLTMGLPKRGLSALCAATRVGNLEVVPIGIPPELVENAESDLDLITPEDLRVLFPRRSRFSHKGVFGHLLLVGGAAGYAGAIGLAARAALRSGAGLVTVLVPRSIAPIVAALAPEAMVNGEDETDAGSLSSRMWARRRASLNLFSAVAAGPGMTRHAETGELVRMMLRDVGTAMVLDADALNVFASRLFETAGHAGALVITPHPGEMARLLDRPIEEVQKDRLGAAAEAARRSRSVAVLKGAGTLIAEEGRKTSINMTGNPGMASGGTGDVLTGLLGGLLAQGINPFDAARAAVHIHGRAGDRAAAEKSEAGIVAGDLVRELPSVFREISVR